MYGAYGNYGINPYQQQQMQTRLNQMEQQYGNYPPYQQQQQAQMQQQIPQIIKGRPVSSKDEAKASMIDLDGSLFVFTDIANKKIYTKQIMLDGTADFKEYVLTEQRPEQIASETSVDEFVLKKDFDKAMERVNKKLKSIGEMKHESNGNDDADNG
jgi:hypothetical protein